eukprot:6392959-Amphidinium_carterae.1
MRACCYSCLSLSHTLAECTSNCSWQIADEKFLVYINDMLSSGIIPDLFAREDIVYSPNISYYMT